MEEAIFNSISSNPPEEGGDDDQQLFAIQTPPIRCISGSSFLRQSNISSSEHSFNYLSGSGGSYAYGVSSFPVESVYGEQMSDCHTEEGVVVNPYYSEPPSIISDHPVMRRVMKSDPPTIDEQQLIKWESQGSASTEGLTEQIDPEEEDDDDDDDDFENSVGCCEEHYREECPKVTEVRGIEPPGDPPEEAAEQTIIVQSTPPTPGEEAKANIAQLEADIQNQLALLESNELSPHAYNGYSHNFITVRDEHRFLMLYTLLKRHADQKIMIFFSTTKSTQYYSKLLQRLKFDVRAAHNGQTREVFLAQYLEFSKQSSGILCIPDFQNDFAIPPSCEWIIQFEPPSNPTEYIFRVGRVSAESSSITGRALLFVTPEQFGVLKYFKAAGVKFHEYEIAKISQVQKDYVSLIRNDTKLRKLGKEAYHAYLMAYASHSFHDVYNIHDINHDNVALAFGFTKCPQQQIDSDEDRKRNSRKEDVDRRWKPVKTEKKDNWMRREKTWRYADRHSSKKMERFSSNRKDTLEG